MLLGLGHRDEIGAEEDRLDPFVNCLLDVIRAIVAKAWSRMEPIATAACISVLARNDSCTLLSLGRVTAQKVSPRRRKLNPLFQVKLRRHESVPRQ